MSTDHAHRTDQADDREHERGHLHAGLRARPLVVFLLTVVLALGLATTATAGGPPGQESGDVLRFADLAPVDGATARLVRGADTLSTRTETRELDHGHVQTLWWVVFNNPEECEHGQGPVACGELDLFDGPDGPTGVEPSCVYADGSLVGGNGHARFADQLRVGEVRDSCIDFFVDLEPGLEGEDHGLTDPQGAEVHLVVRSHGPRIPGEVDQQLRTFAGGCEEFLPAGAPDQLDPGQCTDLQFAVFPVSD